MNRPSRRLDLGSHTLGFEEAGSGDPPIVCLHGLVDDLSVWDLVAPRLAEHRRVLRFDQRGHGKSGTAGDSCTRESLAGDVIGVLDGLAIERCVLLGHSMGGIVAMTTALEYPDRVAGLVLLGTASQCSEKVAHWYERIAVAGESQGLEGLARAIYGEKTNKRIVGDARGISQVTRALKSLYSDPLTPKLAQIRCPVLLVVGEKDPMGSKASEMIAAALPDATTRLQVLPDLGHWLHVDAADTIVGIVEPWLREHV